MYGGRNYRREPVQPRGPGRAPAGVGVQAVRPRSGTRAGHLSDDVVRVGAGDDLARRPSLARRELRGLEPRHDRPGDRDDVLGQHRLRPAHGARPAAGRRADGPPARDPEPDQGLLLGDSRRRGGESAGDGPGLRDVRQRRAADRRRADAERAARRPLGRQEEEHPDPASRRSAPTRRRSSPGSCRASSRAARASGPSSRTDAPSPARRERRRTTATRGSSATRRSWPSPSGSAIPTALRPMLHEYHGSPVAGGTYPAQIFKTFMEKALPTPGRRAGELPVAVVPVRVAAEHRLPRRALARRQRLLPRHARDPLLLRHRCPTRPRTASRTRSRCRGSPA